jgi:hypothetical protein
MHCESLRTLLSRVLKLWRAPLTTTKWLTHAAPQPDCGIHGLCAVEPMGLGLEENPLVLKAALKKRYA